MTNHCEGCTACCQVMSIKEIGLKAFGGCPHMRAVYHAGGPGCGIYARRPYSCRSWSCAWLEMGWHARHKPDRVGVVVDMNLDLVITDGIEMPAAQLWVLPGFENAWKDKDANDIIRSLIEDGLTVIWRMSNNTAIVFAKHPKTGKYMKSESLPPDELPSSYIERAARAGQIYERRHRHAASRRRITGR